MSNADAPRDRLIRTATDLFYGRGLPTVGINEVTSQAGVARMTLYNHFPSKAALALAAFERLIEMRRALYQDHLAGADTPRDRLRAMFEVAAVLATAPDFRGCAFINLAAQELDPDGELHALVCRYKAWLRGILHDNVAAAGHPEPVRAAQLLLALLDGALMEAFIQGSLEPIEAASMVIDLLIPVSVPQASESPT